MCPIVRPERLVQRCALNLQRCTLLALAHSVARTLLSRHLTPPVRPQCRTSSSVALRNSLCQVIRVYSTACFARTAGFGVVLLSGTKGAAFLHSTVRTHDLPAA